jgi:pyrroline-5-carboxylate reductase
MKKIGFIGSGNMASAMMGGLIRNQVISPEEILASAKTEATREKIRENLGVCIAENNSEVAKEANVLVLAVKPQFYGEVIEEIRPFVREEQIMITIAPGWSLEKIQELLGHPQKVVRTMPNTPALVGEGITAFCCSGEVSEKERESVQEILGAFGKAEEVAESLMDVVVSVSGSSPAYVFMMIEAMADAAVADGMPRKQAYTFAAQAVYGSAKMVLETGKHPGELKDMVCSPAGTTIEAVGVLEKKGFRSAIFECMRACVKKVRGL